MAGTYTTCFVYFTQENETQIVLNWIPAASAFVALDSIPYMVVIRPATDDSTEK